MCYPSERQLQYFTVLSRPSTAATPANGKGKKGKATKIPKDVKLAAPQFYNVRPMDVVDESQPQAEIDEEVVYCVY